LSQNTIFFRLLGEVVDDMADRDNPVRDQESLTVVSRDEMNLAEFPFTLLARRVKSGQKTIEISQRVRDQKGKIIKQEWVVTGSDKYGLPLAIDEDIYVALMQLYKESDFRHRRVHFSRYEVLKIMGKESSKREYDIIEQALNRLVTVSVVSKNAFWDNKVKAYVSKAFHLFEGYDLYDEKPGRKNSHQQTLPLSNIVMSEFLFDSIKAGYIKNLDTTFYFSLRTPLSKRLYRYLDKNRYHKRSFEIELLKLAALLPIQDKYPSQIKRRLDAAHTELVEKGFVKSVSYRRVSSSDKEKAIYIFPQFSFRNQLESGEMEETEPSLRRRLVERGITEAGAAKIVESYPTHQIEKQIEVFDWLKERKSKLVEKNPAGFLRKSIEENYQPPMEYIDHRDRRARSQKEEARRERWLRHREEMIKQDFADWDKKAPEERVKGILNFWIAGQKLNGSEPTSEQIEARKQELKGSLPRTDEEKWQYIALNYPEEPPPDFG
jgi:plasmid replication initiation protein